MILPKDKSFRLNHERVLKLSLGLLLALALTRQLLDSFSRGEGRIQLAYAASDDRTLRRHGTDRRNPMVRQHKAQWPPLRKYKNKQAVDKTLLPRSRKHLNKVSKPINKTMIMPVKVYNITHTTIRPSPIQLPKVLNSTRPMTPKLINHPDHPVAVTKNETRIKQDPTLDTTSLANYHHTDKTKEHNYYQTKLKRTNYTSKELDKVLDIPGIQCGKVPIFEKLYNRSINESTKVTDNGDDDPFRAGAFRILHGLDSIPGEWPWIVRLNECFSEDNCYTCTGTLLNDRWVITAGHCMWDRSRVDRFTADIGLYDLVSPDETSYSVKVEKAFVHPDYRHLTNDLTLFKLATPVNFTDTVRPACLIKQIRNTLTWQRYKKCYAVGYGIMEDLAQAVKLQKLPITVKKPSDCNSESLNGVQLRRGTVCIGPTKGRIGGACKGDSGGPNMCYNPVHNQWELFGTVSYGPPNCDRELGDKWLTVAVDLSFYRTWILATILENN